LLFTEVTRSWHLELPPGQPHSDAWGSAEKPAPVINTDCQSAIFFFKKTAFHVPENCILSFVKILFRFCAMRNPGATGKALSWESGHRVIVSMLCAH
jgi:hypothetical protein